MRNDTPAAFPLIALIAGLAIPFVNPWFAVVGLVVASCGFRVVRALLFTALGIVLSLHVQQRDARERIAFSQLHPERFVTIEAPLERDWAQRDDSFLLRASRFRVNGTAFDQPLAVYARFAPPEIAMEAELHAEGFLREGEFGGYTLTIKSPELMSYAGTLPRWYPAAWNRILANRLELHARERPEEVALAHALILGRGERLTESMRESFRRGGTYHLLVFSGLQIALAAALLAALLRRFHAPRASDWLLLAFAVLAPLFIGPTASVARASVGIGLYALSRLLKRPTSIENLWCVAALVRLVLEPRDLTDASFHLTYAGAGALIFIGKHFRKPFGHLLAAETAIAPLTLFHFHQYALGGSIVTLLMSPVIFAMLAVSALACVHPWFLRAIGVLHRLCTLLNAAGIAGVFAAPYLIAMIAGAAGALFAIAALRERQRAVAVTLALLIPSGAAVFRSFSQRNVDVPTVTFFDVGQGDAIAIRSGTKTILVDGGRGRRILPLLADRGVRRIDTVVLSHAHPDHCEGLAAVLAQFDVDTIHITPRRFRGDCAAQILESARAPIRLVRDGDTLQVGDVHLTAHVAEARFRRAPENNASIVLRVEAGERTFLLTGDIEKEAELYLSDVDLSADVLKVAHHGSQSSTSGGFLDNARPRVAVVSSGRRNNFGHPHPAVLDALRERGIRTWRTDHNGTIDVEVRDRRLYVRTGLH
ncbi:MAG TPA: DNA internalization-related competence protein ComEC/Rec2 [Thermoanaerobaculia bacterium]|nr:DNA internalization-related competence protein ComEC/Rec2 [Thermoanaerobaculia bacterium]